MANNKIIAAVLGIIVLSVFFILLLGNSQGSPHLVSCGTYFSNGEFNLNTTLPDLGMMYYSTVLLYVYPIPGNQSQVLAGREYVGTQIPGNSLNIEMPVDYSANWSEVGTGFEVILNSTGTNTSTAPTRPKNSSMFLDNCFTHWVAP